MWLLAIDTSQHQLSVALFEDDRLRVLAAPRTQEQHSIRLFSEVDRVLAEAGLPLAEVGAYALATGPGGFTGLRVGLAAVKAWAEMHARPIAPITVLEAVSAAAQAEGVVVPLVDAYRGQVFAGVYEKRDGELVRRGEDWVGTLGDFLAELERARLRPSRLTLVGPGLERWEEQLRATSFSRSPRERIPPVLAEAIGRRGRIKLARGEAIDALHLEANYVRRSDAELLWREK